MQMLLVQGLGFQALIGKLFLAFSSVVDAYFRPHAMA